MRRATILAMLLAAALVAGCGSDGSRSSDAPATTERKANNWTVVVVGSTESPMCGGYTEFQPGQAVTVEADDWENVGRLGDVGSHESPSYGTQNCSWLATIAVVPEADTYTITVEGENGATFDVTNTEMRAGAWGVRLEFVRQGGELVPGAPAFGLT
jgi:hypothetical protein